MSSLQQIMFVILVVGRWLLPKGHLSRGQLSQLLMFYLGLSADSLEFSIETLSLETVNCDLNLIYAVLALWTWSMMQFTLVRSSVVSNTRESEIDFKELKLNMHSVNTVVKRCCGSEIWSLLMTVLLQDGPFLTMRLFLMVQFNVFNNMMLFFVIKNILVVCIQLYRVFILIFPGSVHRGERDQDEICTVCVQPRGGDGKQDYEVGVKNGQWIEQMSCKNHKDNYADIEIATFVDPPGGLRDDVEVGVENNVDADEEVELGL